MPERLGAPHASHLDPVDPAVGVLVVAQPGLNRGVQGIVQRVAQLPLYFLRVHGHAVDGPVIGNSKDDESPFRIGEGADRLLPVLIAERAKAVQLGLAAFPILDSL